MIARRKIPLNFELWNRRYGSPFGKGIFQFKKAKKLLRWKIFQYFAGPFIFQKNNSTRTFEYPWAFYSASILRGMRVLEIGGGLSGFQFVLNKNGCQVINVDPGLDSFGYDGVNSIQKLNRLFGTSVDFHNTSIIYFKSEINSFDRIFSISVLEHLDVQEIDDIMNYAYKLLKPGGLFIITLDLFLNVFPFTRTEKNRHGMNINVKNVIDIAPFKMIHGNTSELFGFVEFKTEYVLHNLEYYFLGDYPALAQCLVLQK
jgi:2-polyprenyl-3-methyl-5-hydroxy-6-metoxy-1,4-benzoquinol methylase